MQTPKSVELAEPIHWCKCIICVEYFTLDDELIHKELYEHKRRIAAYDGDELSEYIFKVKELPMECAPYYSGEMPTKSELQIEFHCATNNLHEFEVGTDYFTKKFDELGGDIIDMVKLLDRNEKMNTLNLPGDIWDDENTAWNLNNNTLKSKITAYNKEEEEYINACLLSIAIKESEYIDKSLDVETEKILTNMEILDIEQEKIKNNYLESLIGDNPVKIQTMLTEDELFELSDQEDNIDFDDTDIEDFDSDN